MLKINHVCSLWSGYDRKAKLLSLNDRFFAAWVLNHNVKQITIAAWMYEFLPSYDGERLYWVIARLLAARKYEVRAETCIFSEGLFALYSKATGVMVGAWENSEEAAWSHLRKLVPPEG